MKKLLIILAFTLPISAFALPTSRSEQTILPFVTSTYDLGSALKTWANLYVDQICLAADCKTAWPSGGGGGSGSGSVGTSTPLVSGQVDFSTGVNTIGNDSNFLWDNVIKQLTALGAIFTNSTTTNATTTNTTATGLGLFGGVGGIYANAVGSGVGTLGFNSFGGAYNAGVTGFGTLMQLAPSTGDFTMFLESNVSAGTAHSHLQTLKWLGADGVIITPQGLLSQASSTISSLLTANSLLVNTGATTTSLAVTSIPSALLKTNAQGSVIPAVLGTDYINSSEQNYKEAAKYATTAALPTVVYNNGSSGVGATLTGAGVGALSLDSASPSVNDRILVKNQADNTQNGIYTVTATGSGIAVFIMTRASDFNEPVEIETGDAIFVTAGTTQSATTWAYTGADAPTIGSGAITFVQVAGQGSFTAGNGISISGTTISQDFTYSGTYTGANIFDSITRSTTTQATTTTAFMTSASTSNLFVATGLGCLEANAAGKVFSSTRAACGSGGSSASSTLLTDTNGFTGVNTFSDLIATRATTTQATTTNFAISKLASKILKTNAQGSVLGVSASSTLRLFNAMMNPDTGGNAWFEPYTISATNDNFGQMVAVASSTTATAGFYGVFHVPEDYGSNAMACAYWTSPITSGNIVLGMAYRSIGGSDTTSLDQTTFVESVVSAAIAAPTAKNNRVKSCMKMTDANLAPGDTAEFYFTRQGANASDTMAAGVIFQEAMFEYLK